MPYQVLEESETEPLLVKVSKAAHLLSCSPRHIDDLAKEGLLEKRWLGRATGITMSSIRKVIAAK